MMTVSSHCCQKCKTQDTDSCINFLPEILSRLLYTYLHSPSEDDEFKGQYWQLVAGISDIGDGVMFVSNPHTVWVHLYLFCLAGTNIIVSCKVLLY
jgi:hypothetical protein